MKFSNIIKKSNVFYKIIAWILVGVLLSVVGCSVVVTGNIPLKDSVFHIGDVYEIKDSVYKTEFVQENGYQEDTGKIVLDKGSFDYTIWVFGNHNKWNYFCVSLDEVEDQTIKCTIRYAIRNDNAEEKEYVLKDGINLLEIPKNSFEVMDMHIIGDTGNSFVVEKMELREYSPFLKPNREFIIVGLLFIIYVIFSVLLIICLKKKRIVFNLYSWIEVMQNIYILVAGQFRRIVFRLSIFQRRYLRRLCFLFAFVYSVFVEVSRVYYEKFKYHLVIYSVILLFIAIISIEKKSYKRNWNNFLVWGWLLFGGMVCISDFFTPKDFQFWGYTLLFVGGFYYFIWNNLERPEEMICDFVWAVHAFFGLVIVFCLFFRPEMEGMRYSGISKNPSIFALYLGTIGAIVLGTLDNKIRSNRKWYHLLLVIAEGCVVLTFLWKTQSAGPLLCMATIVVIWFFRTNLYLKKKKRKKVLAVVVLSFVLCFVPVYGGITWSLQHTSQSLNSAITFEGETPSAKLTFGTVSYAADIGEKLKDSRLGSKFSQMTVSGLLSGRNYYWKTYLRNMNLLGHKERPIMWGKHIFPHNAVIGIAYNYGIFASIPYIIMLLAIIERTFRYSRKNVCFASIPFYVCLSSIIMSMSDNVEQPFVWLPWMGLYFLMGIAFNNSNIDTNEK